MGLGRALNVAVPGAINTISGLSNLQAQQQNIRASKFKIEQAEAEQARVDRFTPISIMRDNMPNSTQGQIQIMDTFARQFGFIEERNGIEGMTVGNREKLLGIMDKDGKLIERLTRAGIKDTEAEIAQIKTQLEAGGVQQPAKEGGKPKVDKFKPEEIQGRQNRLNQLNQKLTRLSNFKMPEDSGASSPVGKLIQDRDALVKQGLQPTDPRIVAIDNAINKTGAGEAKRSIKTVPDETSSTGFRFKDILSGESFDEAPKPSSLVKINLPKPISPAERTSIAEGEAAIDSLNNIKSLFDEKFVGPIAGRAGTVGELFGANPQEQSSFIAATAAFKNQIIKEITGAQMSEVEAKRILKQVPDVNNPPTVWMARWEQSLRNIERLQKRRIEILRRTFNDGSDLSTISDADLLKQLGGK